MKDWLNSVYSNSFGEYVSNPYPVKNETIKIGLRLKKNQDVKHIFVRYRPFGLERLIEMIQTREYNGLVYYYADIKAEEKKISYQFYLVTDSQVFYYNQQGISDYIIDEGKDFVIPVDYKKCSWINDAVFYQIFPDRFCNGNKSLNVKKDEYTYNGYTPTPIDDFNQKPLRYIEGHNMDFFNGDLYGIIDKLDYLEALGINAIYLNPIFVSPSNHKYDCFDFTHVDPHLGGDKALAKLTEEVHKRGMHIILDISINHTSNESKWFSKAIKDKESQFREYYFFDENNDYDKWCGIETMPKLNYGSKNLKKAIYNGKKSILKKWLNPPYNIDGWRFDVADCLGRNAILDVHSSVIKEIRTQLKVSKEDIYLLAEDWADCSEDLQGDGWDSTMNYFGCNRAIRQFVGLKDLFNERNPLLRQINVRCTASMFWNQIKGFYNCLPGIIQNQMFNLLDSHDVCRLYNYQSVDYKKYLGALSIMFTLPGVPNIYYGDEIALEGRTEEVEFCRYPFNWNYNKSNESVKRLNLYKELIKLRKQSPALKEGGFKLVSDQDYTLCYSRFTDKEVIFIVFSMDDKYTKVNLPLDDYGIKQFNIQYDYLNTPIDYAKQDDDIVLNVAPYQSHIIICNN